MIDFRHCKAFAALALLTVTLCGNSSAADATPSSGIPFTVAVVPGAAFELPVIVGINAGIFKKHGLNVEPIPIAGGGPQLISALASRSVDVTGVSADQIMVANSKGLNIKVIADTYQRSAHVWLANKDWPTPNINNGYPLNFSDLKGARVGVSSRGAQQELLTVMMAKEAGLNPGTDIVFIPVGTGQTAIAALKAKQIDFLVAFEPVPTLLRVAGEGPKIILDSGSGSGDGPTLFRYWTQYGQNALVSALDSRPDVFTKYVRGYQDSIKFMKNPENFDIVLDIAKAWFPNSMGPDIGRQIVERELPRFNADFNCSAHNNLVKYLVDTAQLSKISAPACRDLVWQGASK